MGFFIKFHTLSSVIYSKKKLSFQLSALLLCILSVLFPYNLPVLSAIRGKAWCHLVGCTYLTVLPHFISHFIRLMEKLWSLLFLSADMVQMSLQLCHHFSYTTEKYSHKVFHQSFVFIVKWTVQLHTKQ